MAESRRLLHLSETEVGGYGRRQLSLSHRHGTLSIDIVYRGYLEFFECLFGLERRELDLKNFVTQVLPSEMLKIATTVQRHLTRLKRRGASMASLSRLFRVPGRRAGHRGQATILVAIGLTPREMFNRRRNTLFTSFPHHVRILRVSFHRRIDVGEDILWQGGR